MEEKIHQETQAYSTNKNLEPNAGRAEAGEDDEEAGKDDEEAAAEGGEATASQKEPKKYINNKAGRARYAGWTKDGLALFKELKKKNEAARKNKNTKSIEEGCLARVQCVHFWMRFLCHVCHFF